MIDSVTIYCPEEQPLADGRRWIHRGGNFWDGIEHGLRVRKWGTGVQLEGSLPKFWNGQNATPLTRAQLSSALVEAETLTGYDLRKAFLYQFETGFTLPVKRPPREYLETWTKLGRFKRWTCADEDTVKLVTRGRTFIGYDKRKEVLPKCLPEVFEDCEALRLELTYCRHAAVKKIFGKELSPWDLTEPDIYNALKRKWKDFYSRIPKEKLTRVSLDRLTPTELMSALAHIGLVHVGANRVSNLIATGQQAGDIRKQYAARMKENIRELISNDRITDSTSLTDELDDLVRRT